MKIMMLIKSTLIMMLIKSKLHQQVLTGELEKQTKRLENKDVRREYLLRLLHEVK
jgi:hypothetical protein